MAVKKGKSTYYGIVEIDGELACEQCKTIKPECTTIMHMDGRETFTWVYKCNKCGNQMSVETKRTGEDKKYWK